MQAMPSLIPLSRTASLTSSVMSRTASPPAVRSSVSRWNTFTAPSTLLGRTCHGQPPIVRLRPPYVTGEPSIARAAGGSRLARGHLVLGFGLAGGGRAGTPGGASDGDRALHPLILVPVDRAVHLVGAVLGEGESDGLGLAGLDVPALGLGALAALFDVQRVLDLAVIGDLELVRPGLRHAHGARVEGELLLGDLDRLDDRARVLGRIRTPAAAAGEQDGYGDEDEKAAHLEVSTGTSQGRIPAWLVHQSFSAWSVRRMADPQTSCRGATLRDAGPVAQLVRAADS